MEKKTSKNVHAVSLEMMLSKMQEHAGEAPHPGAVSVLADMKRLTDSVSSLAVIAETPDAEASPEQKAARVMRAAGKLGSALPSVQERLTSLENTTRAGFELAFSQNSGLVSSERAQEIRAHLKGLKDADRGVFVQGLLKDGDSESLAALIFSPAYLSGLDQMTHTRLREQIEVQRLPELSRNRSTFAELAGNLRVALHSAGQAVKDFSNPAKLREFEERAQKTAEAEKRLAESTLPLGGM